jgi:hypothetical protein
MFEEFRIAASRIPAAFGLTQTDTMFYKSHPEYKGEA